MSHVYAAALFDSIDKDHSGSISLQEFNDEEFNFLRNIADGATSLWSNTTTLWV
jgi:hypothetical protein